MFNGFGFKVDGLRWMVNEGLKKIFDLFKFNVKIKFTTFTETILKS